MVLPAPLNVLSRKIIRSAKLTDFQHTKPGTPQVNNWGVNPRLQMVVRVGFRRSYLHHNAGKR